LLIQRIRRTRRKRIADAEPTLFSRSVLILTDEVCGAAGAVA